jgi:hypothetical protein
LVDVHPLGRRAVEELRGGCKGRIWKPEVGSFVGITKSGDKAREIDKKERRETYNADGWGREMDGM